MKPNRILKTLLVLALCAAGALSAIGGGSAAPLPKIWICHGTASETNPYVLIEVSANSLDGHFDADAPLLIPGHGQNSNIDFIARDGDDDCTPPGGE